MIRNLNNKGFTLPELLVAGAIGCAVVLLAAQFIKTNESSNKKVQSDLEDTANNLNMEAMLRKDLVNAKHSLNNLNLKDDTGKKFFDYLSSSTCSSDCSRSIKIGLPEAENAFSSKALYFILINPGGGEQQIFNPADAYDRGTLNFNSLNFNNTLSIRQNTPWGDEVKQRSSLIFVYSPIEVFTPLKGISEPGRILSFMGWVGASNFLGRLNAERITDNGVSFYENTDLRTGKLINSEDEFLKVMPYTAGLGSFAFVAPVKIVRYRMQAIKEKGKLIGQLMRAELDGKKVFNERPVGFNIKSVEFRRETISSPAIYIKLENM